MSCPAALAATAGRLVARTVALDAATAAELDLLAVAGDDGVVWEHDGAGLAGRGVAAVVDVGTGDDRLARAAEAVARLLAGVETRDDVGLPGCGPVALGALPFAGDEPGRLVVPAVVVGRAGDGTAWVTTIGDREHPSEAVGPLAGSTRRGVGHPVDDAMVAGTFRVTTGRPADEWCGAVTAARDEIRSGALEKVVLAREVTVERDHPFSAVELLARLRVAFPACFLFSFDGLVGASPELLVARWGDRVQSQPLAGSAPRGDGPEADARLADALLTSAKEREEHRFVVEAVVDALRPVCETLDAGAHPAIVAMANVQHLATTVHGRLRSPAPSALALAARLHPTPAVCGTPRDAALAAIARWEGAGRGRYAGPVGWVDARGDGQWAVAIRAAELDGRRARLMAGAGIVGGSDPEAELAETQLKLQALLSAVVRP